MAFKPKEKSKTKTIDIYGCSRCKINEVSDPGRMCPCPRGGCEAIIVAEKTTSTQVKLKKIEPPKEIDKLAIKDIIANCSKFPIFKLPPDENR